MDKIIFNIPDIELFSGEIILEFSYLLAALFFVYGLKLLSNPDSARRGNLWSAGGMLLAMLTTIFLYRGGADHTTIKTANLLVIFVAIAIGSVVGALVARRIKMTAMPQLVSLFNASGGAASALVALIEFSNPDNSSALVTLLGLAIGSIAFSGSMIAYGKLDGKINDIFSKWMTYINLIFLAVVVVLVVLILMPDTPNKQLLVYALLAMSVIYGVSFVMPIGGADMPVVISLLNSLTGIAAAMAGVIYGNQAMILGGIFVGAAGMILTLLMCKAMNRSLINVIIGSFGGGGAIVLILSSWLGKVWANRLMTSEKAKYSQELETLKIQLQEQLAIKEEQRDTRMKLYLEYLEPYIKFTFRGQTKIGENSHKNIIEAIAHFTSFEWRLKSLELVLFASDEVAEAWLAYYRRLESFSTSYEEDSMEIPKLFGLVLLAVRKDLGNQDTKLTELDMLSLLKSKSSNNTVS